MEEDVFSRLNDNCPTPSLQSADNSCNLQPMRAQRRCGHRGWCEEAHGDAPNHHRAGKLEGGLTFMGHRSEVKRHFLSGDLCQGRHGKNHVKDRSKQWCGLSDNQSNYLSYKTKQKVFLITRFEKKLTFNAALLCLRSWDPVPNPIEKMIDLTSQLLLINFSIHP